MAEPKHLHVIITNEGEFGYSMRSPQVPGLTYSRATMEEFEAELEDVLKFADAPRLPMKLHAARRFTTPEGQDYLIQVAEDEHRGERYRLAWQYEAVLATDQRHEVFDLSPRNPTGELLFVCAMASDILGDVYEQLPDHYAVIVLGVGETMVLGMEMAREDATEHDGALTLGGLGLTLDSTVGELATAMPIGRGAERRVLTLAG